MVPGFGWGRIRRVPVPAPPVIETVGPLTITDCNVMTGKLQPDMFPCVFGEAGDRPIEHQRVAMAFRELADRIRHETGDSPTPEEVAAGFLAVAVGNMSNAIKKISVQRGHDVTHYTLCCFGGAGGQHACMVADALGMNRILLHPFAGILSAYGMGLADTVVERQRSVERILDAALIVELVGVATKLKGECGETLALQVGGADTADTVYRKVLHVRYVGSDTSFPVPLSSPEGIREKFETLHQMRFGFVSPEKGLMVESIRVEAAGPARSVSTAGRGGEGEAPSVPVPGTRGPQELLHGWGMAGDALFPAGFPVARGEH